MNENESIEFKENYTEKNILCRNKKWQTIKNSNLEGKQVMKKINYILIIFRFCFNWSVWLNF